MLTPILTVRTATGSAEETAARPQQPAAPMTSAQRGEAIQKILDALTRHLAGREILPKDALVRLLEDLARILKFPPLPQEGGRDFVRRLVTFLESMPMPERLALERQLGGRSLALRIGVLADLPAIRNGSGSILTGSTLPGPSKLPLQPAIPLHLAAARAPVAGEVALLQSVLKKTFGVGNESDATSLVLEDMDAAPAADDMAATPRQATPERAEPRPAPGLPPSLDGPEIEAMAATINGEAEPETIEPEASADKPPADEAGDAPARAAAATDDGEIPTKPAEPRNGAARTDTAPGSARAAGDGQEPDGTYRPLPDGEDQRPDDRSATRGNESRAERAALSDAIKTIVRDALGLPGQPAGTGGPEVRTAENESAQAISAAAQSETDGAEPGGTTPLRPRDTTVATELAALSASDEQAEQPGPAGGAAAQRLQKAADDPTMQQAIARLIENGLPREAIPFAMIPYPITVEDGQDEAARSERHEGRSEGDAPEDNGEAASDDASENPDRAEDADLEEGEGNGEPDVYDLYRKLGGLG